MGHHNEEMDEYVDNGRKMGNKATIDIDMGTVVHIIRTINFFNMKCENETLNEIEEFYDEEIIAKNYGRRSLVGPLSGQTISNTVIYNNKLRGKSGAPLFFTSDFLYVVKIIKKSEFSVISKNIANFVEYYQNNPETVLVRYHGVYELRVGSEAPIYFVIMKNVFNGFYSKIFDLKGMDVRRTCNSGILTEKEWENNRLRIAGKERMVEQINRDTKFLQSLNLMDYSLVVGMGPVSDHPDFRITTGGEDKDVRMLKPVYEYSIGIVDTLTEYNALKLAESMYYLFCCKRNRSTVNPLSYQNRFMSLVKNSCFEDIEDGGI
ncbi:hypothetical protein PAEPH01_0500 [Pancytospora epiphaga]|nr:hypothetical protein PAEPH01_0500 [Pancytospora epiphaga]